MRRRLEELADAGCLGALRREPAIAGLNEPLVGLDEEDSQAGYDRRPEST